MMPESANARISCDRNPSFMQAAVCCAAGSMDMRPGLFHYVAVAISRSDLRCWSERVIRDVMHQAF